MQSELTTTPHPHDPHADDLSWSQGEDLLRYFAPHARLHFFNSGPHSVHLLDENNKIIAWGMDSRTFDPPVGAIEDALRNAFNRSGLYLWPDATLCPPPPRYVSIHAGDRANVMRGDECIATAISHNAGKLIAHALNWYKPGQRGS